MILMPRSLALRSSGLSAFACMPRMTVSISLVIFAGFHPHFAGRRPYFSSLDLDGSNISSSDPETVYPLLCKAIARLCITAPPIAMKCTFISDVAYLNTLTQRFKLVFLGRHKLLAYKAVVSCF